MNDDNRLKELIDGIIANSTPKQLGPYADHLALLIRDELAAQIGAGRFGEVEVPGPDELLSTAILIADPIDDLFRLEPKVPLQPPSSEDRAALERAGWRYDEA